MRVKLTGAILAGLAVAGCSGQAPQSEVKFDAAHSIVYDGMIDEGKILTSSDLDVLVESEIEQQLMYTIGQFNGIDGGPDTSKTEISIQEKKELSEGQYEVTYKAKIVVSLPRERTQPENYTLIMPAKGNWAGLNDFFTTYSVPECLDRAAHDVTQGIFWYYYRPERRDCQLKTVDPSQEGKVTRFNVKLSRSDENTENKYPEYDKVWEDGKLQVTSIFGKADEEGGRWDAGVRAFGDTYRQLVRTYGNPISTTLPRGAFPGLDHPEVSAVFRTQSGEMEVNLFLVKGIRQVDNQFIERYNELTKTADFVAYSGHSGLGANIRALARMGTFVQGQYQIFLINGCDTFAYVDDSLRNAHAKVNPGFAPDKFFDMITNAMPSYFHMNATVNMAVINSLVGKENTYRQMLAGFDRKQRAAVTGEQDNVWPAPFEAE